MGQSSTESLSEVANERGRMRTALRSDRDMKRYSIHGHIYILARLSSICAPRACLQHD